MSQFTDQASQIRKGEELDLPALQKYLQDQLPAYSGALAIEQFPKGFSNLTYLIKLGEKQMVLRRPPFGANIKGGHDMGREYRILSHLHGHYAKVPEPILFCENEEIIGAPFYLMDRVNGVILRPKMPLEMAPAPQIMNGIAQSLIATLVDLHALDYKKLGLAEFGKPEGYVQRQIEGWTRRYQKAKTDEITEMDKVAQWLTDHMPAHSEASLIHNDFKYDNVVLDADDWTQVIAVLDWEMATLGDPLMDFGTSLAYWLNPGDPDFLKQMQLSPTTLPGNPSRAEIAELYERLSGRDLGHLVFYYTQGLFKIAVIIQQIYARYKKGLTQDKRFASLIMGVRACATMAWQSIQKGRIDDLF